MRVVVRLFAGLRERAGTGEQQVELAEGAVAADVWALLRDRLGDRPEGLVLAVNRRYAAEDTPLSDGDEVALIPPVSGGSPVRLTADPIDLAAVAAEVADDRAGAIATFSGTTRVESRGRSVRHLDYEAYTEMAEQVMTDLVEALKGKYDLCDVGIVHRTGRVGIGETSVAIAVSAPHRGDALAACAEAIDTLKQTVPLWKKEAYEGGEEWIGRGS
ncbi:MAG TPA: molybdenum cofactor biosynthesis protein MoaE [Gaiellaceae bacterium]|nr:molybdenum cofactor biosynthesis protein MoaE [Gaiellaceae bacterium]